MSLITLLLFTSLFSVSNEPPLQTVRIGVVTGRPSKNLDNPAYLPLHIEAVNFAIAERKKEFAKLGLNIEMELAYTESSTQENFNSIQTLVTGPSLAGIGPQSSDHSVIAAPLVKKHNYLLVATLATGTLLLKEAPHLLMLSASNRELAKVVESFLKSRFSKKRIAALVAWDSAYSQDFFQSFDPRFQSTIQLHKVTEKLENPRKVVDEVMKSDPEVIFLPNFPVSTATLIRSFYEAGFRGVFVGPDSWGEGSDSRFATLLGGVPIEAYTIRLYSRFALRPGEKKLKDHLASLFPEIPYASSAAAYYDAFNYVLDLIREAHPNLTRENILMLSKKRRKHSGALGLNCLSDAQCPDRKFAVVQYKNSQYSLVEEIQASQLR